MKELVARIFQALTLVAGLLWSGLCAAECRILPESVQKTQSAQRELPPCHKQHQPSSQQHHQDVSAGCSTTAEDAAQKQVQLPDFATVLPVGWGATPQLTAVPSALAVILVSQTQAPPPSVQILRI